MVLLDEWGILGRLRLLQVAPVEASSTETVAVGMASVHAVTDPPGAGILVDNHFVGVTPTRFDWDLGAHRLEIKKHGYHDLVLDLLMEKGQRIEVDFKLYPVVQQEPQDVDNRGGNDSSTEGVKSAVGGVPPPATEVKSISEEVQSVDDVKPSAWVVTPGKNGVKASDDVGGGQQKGQSGGRVYTVAGDDSKTITGRVQEVSRNELPFRFTIQVGAFLDRESALKMAAHWRRKGYDAYLLELYGIKDPSRLWQSVRIGRFDSVVEARRFLDTFHAKEKSDGYLAVSDSFAPPSSAMVSAGAGYQGRGVGGKGRGNPAKDRVEPAAKADGAVDRVPTPEVVPGGRTESPKTAETVAPDPGSVSPGADARAGSGLGQESRVTQPVVVHDQPRNEVNAAPVHRDGNDSSAPSSGAGSGSTEKEDRPPRNKFMAWLGREGTDSGLAGTSDKDGQVKDLGNESPEGVKEVSSVGGDAGDARGWAGKGPSDEGRQGLIKVGGNGGAVVGGDGDGVKGGSGVVPSGGGTSPVEGELMPTKGRIAGGQTDGGDVRAGDGVVAPGLVSHAGVDEGARLGREGASVGGRDVRDVKQPGQGVHDGAPRGEEGGGGYEQAMQLEKNGKVEEARALYQQVITRDPGNVPARQRLARIYVESGMAAEALTVLKPAVAGRDSQSLARDDPNFSAFLAALYQRQEEHWKAVDLYEALLQNYPEKGIWQMGMAISLEKLNETANALRYYEKALEGGELSTRLRNFVQKRVRNLK